MKYYTAKKRTLEGLINLAKAQKDLKIAARDRLNEDIESLNKIIEARTKELEKLQNLKKSM